MNARTFLTRHALMCYILLVFIISWGGILILGSPYGMPTTQETFQSHWPIVFIPYLLGPIISSFLLTSLIYGKNGLKNLLAKFVTWKVDIKWYLIALFTAPILILIVLLPMSIISTSFLPALFTSTNKYSLVFMGLAVGLFGGGLLEEPGWTGFALPELLKKRGYLVSGIILGVIWGIWHIFPTYWGSGDSRGIFDLSLFLPPCIFYIGVLPSYRVLLVMIYGKTKSLLIAMIMHMSLTASSLFILAPAVKGNKLTTIYLILTGLLWLTVIAVMINQKNEEIKSEENDLIIAST